MQGLAGSLLFLAGGAGFLFPEETVRFCFFGLVEEGGLSTSGVIFFRVLGFVCMLVGLVVAFS